MISMSSAFRQGICQSGDRCRLRAANRRAQRVARQPGSKMSKNCKFMQSGASRNEGAKRRGQIKKPDRRRGWYLDRAVSGFPDTLILAILSERSSKILDRTEALPRTL